MILNSGVSIAMMTTSLEGEWENTLEPLAGKQPPATVEELWEGFDPRREPLDVEILKEWEQDGVVMRVVRYRIGIFKGRAAMMAAVYGYPANAKNLPALVQVHGGGQYAHANAVLTNARRGYASISLSWGGRIDAPGYKVTPNETRLFWEEDTGNPAYRVCTDWGALDAYHAPSRNAGNSNWSDPNPAEWTVDSVASPRNSNWFLVALAVRRALTFLESQPEVDADRLGIYGHSMGGKLTVMAAGVDSRIKAAAPSCGGVSARNSKDARMRGAVDDDAYLRRINCPVMFLSPANDFHGRIDDLQTAVDEIQTEDWRATCSPHHNHQDTAQYEVATQLWMDQYLKKSFKFPATPGTDLQLASGSGQPVLMIQPSSDMAIEAVEVYYSQHGLKGPGAADMKNTIARFWHFSAPQKDGNAWKAILPLGSTDKPLWVYANVVYRLPAPVTGAGYYYGTYTADRFVLSSRMHMVTPDALVSAGVTPALTTTPQIESFGQDWEKEWFTYRPQEWGRFTHKLYSDVWKAPPGSRLGLQVRSRDANKMVVGLDETAVELALAGGENWQSVLLSPGDFKSAAGTPRDNFNDIRELGLTHKTVLRENVNDDQITLHLGAEWSGPDPEFRNLRWVSN